MSLKIRLSLLFALLVGSILFLFAMLIYFSAANDRRKEFFNHLQKEALTRANLLLDAEVEAQTLQTIYLSNREILHEVEVAVYDPWFNLIYHDAVEIDFVKETPEMIREILEKGEIRFVQEGWEVIGMVFHFNGKTYVLTAAAFDQYGHTKLRNLLNNLILFWLAGVVLIAAAGWFFARRTLKPIALMVKKANEITATNLDLRLNEGKRKDELYQLAATFNRMLDRLQDSFEAQKEFVSNIAHELRTPLAAVLGETELALSREKSSQEYQQALAQIHADSRKLSRLITGLLDLARASYDRSAIALTEVRLDEILLDARSDVLKVHPKYEIDLLFDDQWEEKEEEGFVVKGNEYLLRVAFANLMENGCKFSAGKPVKVSLEYTNGINKITIADNGPGIPDEDMEMIFKPFFRGKNKELTDGSGIGLPLVERIMLLHNASFGITSSEAMGTKVEVSFQ
ncbi:MAG: ATP-binding protein [Bacteroidales bacterium]